MEAVTSRQSSFLMVFSSKMWSMLRHSLMLRARMIPPKIWEIWMPSLRNFKWRSWWARLIRISKKQGSRRLRFWKQMLLGCQVSMKRWNHESNRRHNIHTAAQFQVLAQHRAPFLKLLEEEMTWTSKTSYFHSGMEPRKLIHKPIHHVNRQWASLIRLQSKLNQMKKWNLSSQRAKSHLINPEVITARSFRLSKRMPKSCMELFLEAILKAAIDNRQTIKYMEA